MYILVYKLDTGDENKLLGTCSTNTVGPYHQQVTLGRLITSMYQKRSSAFTIVELLIVIVVIAILAAITIMAYNGIQSRARDSQRAQDIQTIASS